MKQLIALLVLLCSSLNLWAQEQVPDAGQAGETPYQVIETAATSLQQSLVGKQDYYGDNLDELYQLIDDKLLPVFDVRYSGYLVLGNHWKPATEEQRSRFIEAFYTFLVRSYAKGLLGFNQQDLEIYPEVYSKDKKKAEVRTELKLANGTKVPVNYRLRNSKRGWRVYDVRIEGVSYVQNYRSQFNAEIAAEGIDAVIQRLETEQEKAIESPLTEAAQTTG